MPRRGGENRLNRASGLGQGHAFLYSHGTCFGRSYYRGSDSNRSARRRGEGFDQMRFATLETLTHSPLPCWKHLPEEKRRKLAADLIAEIEAEAAVRRQRTGSQALGASAVRGQHPFDHPAKSKKSPAPLFHAASKAVRRELYAMYGWFVAAFREASEKLRAGNRTASFPTGSFPPALPFVAA